MSIQLPFKIYCPRGALIASTRFAEEAAMLVATLGDGYEIRSNRKVLWTEGKEEQSASESYDHVAEVCEARI